MGIFLSVNESLKYWRSDTPYIRGELLVTPATNVAFRECESSVQGLSGFNSISSDNAPLELLVSSHREMRRNKQIATRLIETPLPERSFYQKEQGLYVCSPELIFLLAARMAPLRSLIALGCELCGTYSLNGASSAAIKHAQITDVKTISEYLNKVPGMRGIKDAKQALQYVADGSASPRETDVYMQYCLKPKLGSFGLGGVKLNHTIDLKNYPQARNITNLEKITPDLYWPKYKIAIEYESTQWHGAYVSNKELQRINRRKLADDSTRRRTYEAMGIFALSVTDGEFCNYNDVERIAKLLMRRMNKHGFRDSMQDLFRRSELHDWLKVPAEARDNML